MTQPEDLIVGKSVEEIEAESGNRVNSPVSGEDRAEEDRGTVLVPGGAQTGAGALGGLPGVFGTQTGDDGSGPRRNDADRDSSEE